MSFQYNTNRQKLLKEVKTLDGILTADLKQPLYQLPNRPLSWTQLEIVRSWIKHWQDKNGVVIGMSAIQK